MARHYEEDFKKQIVEIFNQGNYTYKKLGEEYDIAPSTIRGWVNRYNNSNSFDKIGCEILFKLLSFRNDKGSIILTTNLNFERWEEVFKDPMLTGAILDRLAHRVHIMDMSRKKSNRMEDTIE